MPANETDWTGFKRIKDGNVYKAVCDLCEAVLANTAYKRRKSHRNFCEKNLQRQSVNRRNEPQSESTNKNTSETVENEKENSSSEATEETPSIDLISPEKRDNPVYNVLNPRKRKPTRQTLIPKFMLDSMEPEEKKIADAKLADFMFACNIPFEVANSQYFIDFLEYLRPAYKIPHSNTLKTTLLNEAYARAVAKGSSNEIRKGTLMIDGWKNKSNSHKNVTFMVKARFQKPLFLKSFDYTTISENAENLGNSIAEACAYSNQMYKIDPDSIVSDNAANVVRACKDINLINYTCTAHTGNLYLGDIIDKDLAGKVRGIIVEFRKPALMKTVVDLGGVKSVIAGDTRWKAELLEIDCFIRNRPYMRQAAALDNQLTKVTEETLSYLYDEDFYKKIQKEAEKIRPVCNFIDVVQGAETTLADAVDEWLKLPVLSDYRVAHENRQSMIMSKPAKIAYALHPKYRGSNLSVSDWGVVDLFMLNKLRNTGEYCHYYEYKEKRELFAKEPINKLSSELFWKTAKGFCPELAEVGLTYCSLPSSTASLERLFSQWSYVHNSTRNRLTDDKSEKLAFVYHSLKMTDSHKCDAY